MCKVVNWQQDRAALQRLRLEVFEGEQGVPRELERDGCDEAAIHFLIMDDAGQPVACGRLLDDGKVGRMAVRISQRGLGLGRRILSQAVDQAKQIGLQRLYLHAQRQALGFYSNFGFVPVGEEFVEAGIPHQAMAMELDYRGYRQRISGPGYPQPFAQLAVELAASARRELRIFSPELDREVFGNPDLVSAIAALARKNRLSLLRILVTDTRSIVKRGHRLLELARRLPSSIAIQVISDYPGLATDTFLIRDLDGMLFKPADTDNKGFYEPDSRPDARAFITHFDELWLRSRPDPELRALQL